MALSDKITEIAMEKLAKLLIRRSPSREHDESKKSSNNAVRRARHRYERPKRLQHQDKIQSQAKLYEQIQADMLQMHNYYRARHSASPLTISQRLNYIAQRYAEYLAATGKFEHSGNRLENETIGENLYMQWISEGRVPVNARQAAKSWYDEIQMYNYKRPVYSEDTGHFTQLVWRSSKRLGVGVALSKDGREVYIVTNYYPAGNIVNQGYFERNVLPPTK